MYTGYILTFGPSTDPTTGASIYTGAAMGMCWSGYLSTHVGMMNALNARELTSKAILSQTIGGICAGISAHFIFIIIT